jgi:hypothetical protein
MTEAWGTDSFSAKPMFWCVQKFSVSAAGVFFSDTPTETVTLIFNSGTVPGCLLDSL